MTNAGASLARDLDAGFTTIRRSIETLTGADAARPVQITMPPAFALLTLYPILTGIVAWDPFNAVLMELRKIIKGRFRIKDGSIKEGKLALQ